MRIGVVKEGFGWEGLSEESVDKTVLKASKKFLDLGVQIEHISVPLHRDGIHIWKQVFENRFYGYSSAMSILYLYVTIVICWLLYSIMAAKGKTDDS